MDVFIFQILCQFICNFAGSAFAFAIYKEVKNWKQTQQDKQLKRKTRDITFKQLKQSSTRQHIKQSIHSKLSNDNIFVFMWICCYVHDRCNVRVRIQVMNSVLV
jgi:hypothetical protein